MRYVTKLGAYGLAAAAAFAVALAVLVSVSSTPTAEAATINFDANDSDNAVQAAPGDTVNVAVASAFATVSITGTADGVGASFVSGGGQTVSCGDDASCDVDDSDPNTTGKQNVPSAVSVALKIDADSGEGHILLSVGGVGVTPVTKVINVSKATLVGSLKITATPKTIAAADGESTLVINVQNAAGTPAGLNDQSVSLVTTLGTIECVSGTEVQACSVSTANSSGITNVTDGTAGYATVTLNGKGVEGKATITARLGTRTATATVTLFGTAKNLTAEPLQGSVEIGGSVYVVLTVTDGADNPVSGLVIAPVTSKEVVGPNDDAVLVKTEKDSTGPTAAEDAAGTGYSRDLIRSTAQGGNIPACGDDGRGRTASPVTEAFADANDGTNADGKCVVYVTAPAAAGTQKAATRGVHMLNFQVSSTVKASAMIEVAGAPASITTDAADRVDTSSTTEITVSVWDDDDVLVGITDVKVRKVAGDGLIEDNGTDNTEKTSNGKSKFTLIAPSESGSIEILITAGKAEPHRLTVHFGEEVMEEPEEPAMPEPTEPELSGNAPLMIFSGGSVEDLHSAAEAACAGGAVVWIHDGTAWQVYSTTAIAIANSAFNAAFGDGIDMQAVWVSSCEADAMESEG